MAHEVETMMYAGQVPWHGLGKSVEKELNSADAIVAAGLDWETETRPMYVTEDNGYVSHEVDGVKAVVRKTDFSTLGVVGGRYQPVQNKDAFSFFDAIVGEGKAVYHTAGSLFSGKKVWILAKVPGEILIGKDDLVEKYLLLSNTHDGSGTLKMAFTPTRVVCSNTLNIALRSIKSQVISIRHTKSVNARMESVAQAMTAAGSFYEAFNVEAQKLFAFKYTAADMVALTNRLFPTIEGEEDAKSTIEKRERVSYLFDNGKGHKGIQGTAYAALNAVAEFADHGMRTRMPTNDKRADSIWFGAAAALKQRGADIIASQMAA